MTSFTQSVRKPTESDRLFNVRGYPEEFLDALCKEIDDPFNPRWLFCIGAEQRIRELVTHIKRLREDLDDKHWLGTKPDLEKNGARIPYCFASEQCANHFIDTYNHKNKPQSADGEPWGGNVGAVILFEQDGKEQYLSHILRCCKQLKAFLWSDRRPEAMEIGAWEESIPLSVDLNAPQGNGPALREIPSAAMFGKCRELAKQTRCPLGYAYVAAVTAVSVLITGSCNIRAAIYGAPLGDIHSGKSLSSERVMMLLGLQDESGNPIGDSLVIGTPASDRGLYKLLPEKEFRKRLLYEDEARNLMQKGNIQGSALIPTLCALWSRNRSGVADKFGLSTINVELSMLLNFKVGNPSEFPGIFTHETSHGLYDRFLLGVRGDEKWRYAPWDFNAERDVFKLEPSTPHVPAEIFEAAHAWSSAGEDRDRLAEIALRVAYITSAANGDKLVSRESVDAALCLMSWQENIRKVFQPAKGANEAEECVKTVLAAFTKENGYSYNWREMGRKHHWYEKFARTLAMTKKNLIAEKLIGFDKATGRHYLTEEKSQ
jgi:hypothetical protein